MRELGKKHIKIILEEPLNEVPEELKSFGLAMEKNNTNVVFSYDSSDKIAFLRFFRRCLFVVLDFLI